MTFPVVLVALNVNIAVPMATPLMTYTELSLVSSAGNEEINESGAGLRREREREQTKYTCTIDNTYHKLGNFQLYSK